MSKTPQLCITLAVYLFWLQILPAQQLAPLPLEVVLRGQTIAELSSVEFSPDGKWLAYVVKDNTRTTPRELAHWMRTGTPLTANGCDVWVMNIGTGEARNISEAKGDNWLPKWSPDGRHLAFLSNRDGSSQARLWVWNAATSALNKVSESIVRTDQIEWTPDGRHLLVSTLPADLSLEEYLSIVGGNGENEAKVSEGSTVKLFHSVPHDESGAPPAESWNLNVDLRDLSLIELASGGQTILIRKQRIRTCAISPDGKTVACTIAKRFDKPGSQQVLYELSTLDFAAGVRRTIVSEIPMAYDGAEFSWSPDSTLLSYHTGWTSVNDCFVVPASGGTPRNVTNFGTPQAERYKLSIPLWDDNGKIYLLRGGSVWVTSPHQDKAVILSQIKGRRALMIISRSGNQLWTTDHDQALVLAHDDEGKQDGFYSFDLKSGETRQLLEKGQCYVCGNMAWSFAAATFTQGIVYLAEDAEHGAELWYSDGSFRNPKRLTHLNPAFDRYKLGGVRLINWLSDDGIFLRGALLLPSGYQEGTRYPLVVWVYGGGSLSDNFDRFGLGYGGPLNFQLLATRGFAVLLPDSPQRESTAVADLVKTVLPGVNKTVELGVADPKSLAVMGLSNGGYSTLALIGQTKRFKCAVEIDGMGDLTADYGAMSRTGAALAVSLLEHGQDAMGGPPWQFPLRYLDNSPIFSVDRVETPLLMVQGMKDETVPPFLGDEVFVALRRLGKEVEYLKYGGEDHSPLYWSYANQLDLSRRVLAWLDKYLHGTGEEGAATDPTETVDRAGPSVQLTHRRGSE